MFTQRLVQLDSLSVYKSLYIFMKNYIVNIVYTTQKHQPHHPNVG